VLPTRLFLPSPLRSHSRAALRTRSAHKLVSSGSIPAAWRLHRAKPLSSNAPSRSSLRSYNCASLQVLNRRERVENLSRPGPVTKNSVCLSRQVENVLRIDRPSSTSVKAKRYGFQMPCHPTSPPAPEEGAAASPSCLAYPNSASCEKRSPPQTKGLASPGNLTLPAAPGPATPRPGSEHFPAS